MTFSLKLKVISTTSLGDNVVSVVLIVKLGAVVSIEMSLEMVLLFPAASAAFTTMVCEPSVKAGNELSGSVHVPSPIFVAG